MTTIEDDLVWSVGFERICRDNGVRLSVVEQPRTERWPIHGGPSPDDPQIIKARVVWDERMCWAWLSLTSDEAGYLGIVDLDGNVQVACPIIR